MRVIPNLLRGTVYLQAPLKAFVSIGLYKANPNIGGDFRIGVTQSSQGKGCGKLCILFAFSQLARG